MANGDPIHIGQVNTGRNATTLIRNVPSHETVFVALNLNAGSGILSQVRDGLGVEGSSTNSTGVQGFSTDSVGVRGWSWRSFGGFFRGPPSTTGSSGSLRLLGTVVKSQGEYSEALPHPDGSQRLLYAPLSPESWYEDFGRANLSGARGITDAQLEQAESLAGATMPDGQTLKSDDNPDGPTPEEWLKSKGRE